MEGGTILKEIRIKDSFTLVNAYSLTTSDKLRLQTKYKLSPHMFDYIGDSAQIPRYLNGSHASQYLFIFDIPAHHHDYTVPLSLVIDDNTSIIVFTNRQTKYVIPMMSELLNEKANEKYGAPHVALDVAHKLANFYLDKIRSVDEKRVKDKELLRDRTKHRNQAYTDHLTHLQVESSGTVTSLASDLQLMRSIYKLFGKYMDVNERKLVKDDMIIYHQVLIEAKFSADRIEKVLNSFNRRVNMGNSYKLGFLSVIAFVLFPSDSFFGFMGINLPPNSLGQMGLPIKNVWVVLIVAAVFDLCAWLIWHFWIKRK